MRITAATIYRESSVSIERASERLLEFQRQVASGKRITRPSDDPAGAAASVGERGRIGGLEQYSRTADSVLSRLSVVDSALSDIIDRLTQAQVAVVSAQGSAKTPADREVAAQTLEGVRDAILSDLNTSFRGTHVFAGADSATPPFVVAPDGTVSPYQGSALEVGVDIGERRQVTIGFDGAAIAQGPAGVDIFGALDAAIAAARAGDGAGLAQALTDLGAAFERATTTQMRVGTSLAAIDAQRIQLSDRRLAGQTRVAALEDANLSEAITGMTQADAAYRAALGATGRMTQLSLMDYLR
jgi:flagellar hook-associated protein 3 FlgL